jgi:hypothetical protein
MDDFRGIVIYIESPGKTSISQLEELGPKEK